jgi:hypothetical protein
LDHAIIRRLFGRRQGCGLVTGIVKVSTTGVLAREIMAMVDLAGAATIASPRARISL